MTSGFNFLQNSNTNSSQTTGNTNNLSQCTTVPTMTFTNISKGTGSTAITDPSTPSAPPPFEMSTFTFNNSTTPIGQPPTHPLGQSNTLGICPIDNKGFHTETTNTTGGLFNTTMGMTPKTITTETTSTPTTLETSGTGMPLFNNKEKTTPKINQTSSTSTPFVFGTTTPQLNTKSASQDKPTTTFSFTGFPEKGTQTQQEESSKTTPSFSFGGLTPSFSFGTNEKTNTPFTSLEKPPTTSDPLKATPTFSFGNLQTQKNQPKAETPLAQKPEESKPTFAFGVTTPSTIIKDTVPNTNTSTEVKPSPSGDTSVTTASTLFKPQTPVSSDTPSFGAKESSQTSSKPASDTTKSLPSTSTQEPGASNLKNKTIEDIINKWTSDLDNYSRQFTQQATEVSKWDRLLIESGDKISKLYADTIEAEQTQLKVDQTLTYIENQQNEMSAFLDQYENQVQELSDRQFGGPDGMQPADQEREKVYNLAEKLTEQLDGLGKNLESMIDEINTASNMINKTNEDDPLSSIVRILNSHLSNLQWIQSTTTKLHYKIEEVKKAEHAIEKQLEENSFYNRQNIGFS
ncbi:hypothetical protein PCANB_002063 [Pneumocystis canis]|nr:hypothetical protein PCK1_001978 [Pneumocystis canis]KAG5439489.1 hypothetical protein PCANB_002063 [Pneumocystis canis]